VAAPAVGPGFLTKPLIFSEDRRDGKVLSHHVLSLLLQRLLLYGMLRVGVSFRLAFSL